MGRIEGLEVVRSRIHGYGMIARRRFAKGELVCYGDGVLWRDEEEFDDTYALILEDEHKQPLFWDLADQTRWLNHSCDPNSVVDAKFIPARETVEAAWTALRDIEIGEEVTYDYAFAASVAEPCYCGAAACRGVIVDPGEIDQLPDDLRRRLTIPSGPGDAVHARALIALAIAAALAGGAHADDDPMAYADIATGRPTGIKCPDARPCVVDKDGAFFVTAKGWKRYYVLDHTEATSALLAGAEDDAVEIDRRVDAAVRAILAFHAAKKAAVDCAAAGAVPSLVGSKTGVVSVAVPQVKASKAPAALSPAEADAAWMKAREAIDAHGGSTASDAMTTLFAGVDTTAMTASTFKRPHLRSQRATLEHRVCKGADCRADEIVDVNVLVVYSPESAKVYVIDRSVTLPTTEWTRDQSVRAFADQDVLFATLRALGVKSMVVDPGSLCAVPRVAGKNGWFNLK